MEYSQFVQKVTSGQVEKVIFEGRTIHGQTNRTYYLESSTNLLNMLTDTNQVFLDGDTLTLDPATNGVQRFYRARLAP